MLKVGLDIGHGGKNLGTRSLQVMPEKEYTLLFGKQLSEALRAAGFEVVLSRWEDETVFFAERAKRLAEADIVLCLHVNAATSPKANGFWGFYMPTSLKSKTLTDAIVARVGQLKRPSKLFKADQEWKEVRNCIQRYHQPTALLELGFGTNEAERKYLLSPEGQQELVLAIVHGVRDYAAA